MILRLDGRRLDITREAELLCALALDDLAATLLAQGWNPAPSRAPGRIRNGRVMIRLTWTRTIDGGCQVIRATHVATAAPAQ